MAKADLPITTLNIAIFVVKKQVTNVIGDDTLIIIAEKVLNLAGKKNQGRIESIFATRQGAEELLKAIQKAGERFSRENTIPALQDIFTGNFIKLTSIQKAIKDLPKTLDEEDLSRAIPLVLSRDYPVLTPDQVQQGSQQYLEYLQQALLTVKDFTLKLIMDAILKIENKIDRYTAEELQLLKETLVKIKAYGAKSQARPKFLVPFRHNPDFFGRAGNLQALHAILQHSSSPVGICPTILVGTGGIGKTHLAVEYAYAHRAGYIGGIYWLNAVNPLQLELAKLAEELGFAETGTQSERAARQAWNYLDAHPDALVVFDNLIDPSSLNTPFLPGLIPANLGCQKLFTTRQRDFPREFKSFEVNVLPIDAALQLLLRARPDVLAENHPEWSEARRICFWLGCLPLALDLSAAYLATYPEISMEEYSERLRTEGKLDTDTELRPEKLPGRHDIAVHATLQTHWVRLTDEDTRLLFRAAGQFPEGSWIPVTRLGLVTGIQSQALPGQTSPLTRGLKKLYAISLIEELTAERLRLHPLVHEFAAQLSPAGFRAEMAAHVAEEFGNLNNLEQHVARHGIDMVLEDVRTGLGFSAEEKTALAHAQISNLEHILSKELNHLRDWQPNEQRSYFLQQLRNRALDDGVENLQRSSENLLAERTLPWLAERFPAGRASPALRHTFEKHTFHVHGVAITPDGKSAISPSKDNTLRLWDLANGQTLHTFEGHASFVNSVAVTPDGKHAISASWDNTLRLWDLASGQTLHTFEGHLDGVHGVAVTPDGKRAISASADGTLRPWDLANIQNVQIFEGHTHWVNGVAVTPDGKCAISASEDKTLRLWDLASGRTLHIFKGHTSAVNGVAVTPDGKYAISASGDQTLRLWDLANGQTLRTFEGHKSHVNGVAVTPDGKYAISASGDKTLRLWNLANGQTLRTFRGHTKLINGMAVTPDGKCAISASADHTLRLWDLANGTCLLMLTGDAPFECCTIDRAGSLIVAGDYLGRVHIIEIRNLPSLDH